jgi:hypothetical protein
MLWWNSLRQVFMWSYPSNSTNAQPFDLVGSSLWVRQRTDFGFTEAKCEDIEALVAVKGRLPGYNMLVRMKEELYVWIGIG